MDVLFVATVDGIRKSLARQRTATSLAPGAAFVNDVVFGETSMDDVHRVLHQFRSTRRAGNDFPVCKQTIMLWITMQLAKQVIADEVPEEDVVPVAHFLIEKGHGPYGFLLLHLGRREVSFMSEDSHDTSREIEALPEPIGDGGEVDEAVLECIADGVVLDVIARDSVLTWARRLVRRLKWMPEYEAETWGHMWSILGGVSAHLEVDGVDYDVDRMAMRKVPDVQHQLEASRTIRNVTLWDRQTHGEWSGPREMSSWFSACNRLLATALLGLERLVTDGVIPPSDVMMWEETIEENATLRDLGQEHEDADADADDLLT